MVRAISIGMIDKSTQKDGPTKLLRQDAILGWLSIGRLVAKPPDGLNHSLDRTLFGCTPKTTKSTEKNSAQSCI